MNIDNWNQLEVVGIIDSYGAVHSKLIKTVQDYENIQHDSFGLKLFDKWRWNEDKGVFSLIGERISAENYDKIIRHLKRKYKKIKKYLDKSKVKG